MAPPLNKQILLISCICSTKNTMIKGTIVHAWCCENLIIAQNVPLRDPHVMLGGSFQHGGLRRSYPLPGNPNQKNPIRPWTSEKRFLWLQTSSRWKEIHTYFSTSLGWPPTPLVKQSATAEVQYIGTVPLARILDKRNACKCAILQQANVQTLVRTRIPDANISKYQSENTHSQSHTAPSASSQCHRCPSTR